MVGGGTGGRCRTASMSVDESLKFDVEVADLQGNVREKLIYLT